MAVHSAYRCHMVSIKVPKRVRLVSYSPALERATSLGDRASLPFFSASEASDAAGVGGSSALLTLQQEDSSEESSGFGGW